jgi:hypothetical protein
MLSRKGAIGHLLNGNGKLQEGLANNLAPALSLEQYAAARWWSPLQSPGALMVSGFYGDAM